MNIFAFKQLVEQEVERILKFQSLKAEQGSLTELEAFAFAHQISQLRRSLRILQKPDLTEGPLQP